MIAVVAILAVNSFITKRTSKNMIAVNAITVMIKITAIHTVFVINGIGQQVTVFAPVSVIAKIAVHIAQMNHPNPRGF
jgi:hypothetical protein